MAVKLDAMQKCAGNEIEIPEGKVENMVSQWLVHEDSGLAYKLQEEEIEEHLNHNKIRNQTVRSDLKQAKHIQQTEQQFYQQQRQLRQAQLDEQLAKELQLNLIEEEQKQMMEQQRIADEDEKYAKSLHEREKQKVQRRKLQREQAQIEKIKRDRLQYYLDNNLDITSTMNDDLDELDLSDFCMKPPDQLRGDQLQLFMAEQDEELARFLQIYESQKKTSLIKDKQELQENQDYEIARLIYEEEKAKLRRLKEKRLAKQRLKQAQARQDQASQPETSDPQQEYYIPDNRLFRLPNSAAQSTADQSVIHENADNEQSLYDTPMHESVAGGSLAGHDRSFETAENLNHEETNLKQLIDDRPTSSNSSSNSHPQHTRVHQHHKMSHESAERQLRYQSEDNAQYTLSTKQMASHHNIANHVSNQNALNFVTRALPPVPAGATKFHNIACDIDPTYKSKKDKSKDSSPNDSGTLKSSESSDSARAAVASGLHYAQLARVEMSSGSEQNQNEYDLVEQNCVMSSVVDQNGCSDFGINQATAAQSLNYAMHNQQMTSHYMPVQGQKRTPQVVTNQKKTKKEKTKDKCRQQ